MRFHLVDRVLEHEASKSIRAVKLTSSAESYWELDPNGVPEMPRPLLLECLCQAGTWLIMLSTNCERRAALLQVGRAEFHGAVRPGSRIEIEAQVVTMSEEIAVLSGTASVDGTVVTEATDIMCALMSAGDLEAHLDSQSCLKALTRS